MVEINFKDLENQVDDEDLAIGMMTKQVTCKFLDDRDVTVNQLKVFYKAIRAFYIWVTEYLSKWCLLHNKLLVQSIWIDFESRLEWNFSSTEYFIGLYPNVFVDTVQEVHEKCGLQKEGVYHIDDLWSYLEP